MKEYAFLVIIEEVFSFHDPTLFDFLDVLINRKNAVHSSINSFKNLEESEILQNLYVGFLNESGSDAGNFLHK